MFAEPSVAPEGPCPAPRPELSEDIEGGGGMTLPDPRLDPEGPCPEPCPELSEDIEGGGGTMLSAERTVPKPPGVELCPRPPAFMDVPPLTLGGGGTT
jgi:hypothetical protein